MQIRIRATGWAIIDSARPGSGPEGAGGGGRERGGEQGPPENTGGRLEAWRREHTELPPGAVSAPASWPAKEDYGPWAVNVVGSWETESKGLWGRALRGGGRLRPGLPTPGGTSNFRVKDCGRAPSVAGPSPQSTAGSLGLQARGESAQTGDLSRPSRGRGSIPTPCEAERGGGSLRLEVRFLESLPRREQRRGAEDSGLGGRYLRLSTPRRPW